MSSGLELVFLQDPRDEKWYYVLQNWDCPAECWDWMEYATATGPFASYDKAHLSYSANEQNAGGHAVWSPKKLGSVEEKLVTEAHAPKKLWSNWTEYEYW